MHIDDFLELIGTSKRSKVVKIITKVLNDNPYAQFVARTCYVLNNPKLTKRKVLNCLVKDGLVYKIVEFKEYKIIINF